MQISALNTLPNFINCILQELGPVPSIVKFSPEIAHKKKLFLLLSHMPRWKIPARSGRQIQLFITSIIVITMSPSSAAPFFQENHKTTRNRNIPQGKSALERLFFFLFPFSCTYKLMRCRLWRWRDDTLHSREKGQSMEASNHQSWNGEQNPLAIFKQPDYGCWCWQVFAREGNRLGCGSCLHISWKAEEKQHRQICLCMHHLCERKLQSGNRCRYIASGNAGWLHSKEKII